MTRSHFFAAAKTIPHYLGLEEQYQAKMLEIGNRYAGKRTEATRQDTLETNPFFESAKGGFFGGMGVGSLLNDAELEKATASADYMKAVYAELGSTVGDIFGSMLGASQSMLENFILTGEVGGAAFAQLAASIISSLTVQSGVKALFETAEGFASAAIGDVRGAAMHFAAAKIYAGVALAAGAVGVGIGLTGGLGGGNKNSASAGSSGGGSSNERPDYYTVQNPPPQQQNAPRFNADPTTQKLLEEIMALRSETGGLRETFTNFDNKIGSMKPGEVLTRGAGEKKGFLLQTVNKELKDDPTAKRKFGETLNLE